MDKEYFCSQEKTKNFQKYFPSKRQRFAKSIPWKKAKIRKKYSLRKGKVLQKVFSVFWYYEERFKLFELLIRYGKKRGLQVQDICIGSKKHNNNWFESCALRYSLATEDRSSGKEEFGRACWGGRLWSLHHCATAFAEANSFRNQRQPHILWTKTITMSGKN